MLLLVRFIAAFVILLSGICVAQTPQRVKATPAKATPITKTAYKAPTKKATPAKPTAQTKANYKAPAPRAARSLAARPQATRARATRTPVRSWARPAYYYQMSPTPERYREIQQALIDRGFLASAATGQWNQESVEALNRFKKEQNLKVDGKLDSLSLIALGLGPKRPADISTVNLPLPSPAVTQALEHE